MMSFLKRVHCHQNREREDKRRRSDGGRKEDGKTRDRTNNKKNVGKKREVNDRVNSSVTARNGDVHKVK